MIDFPAPRVRSWLAIRLAWIVLLTSGLASAQNLRTQTYTELEGLLNAEVADLALAPDGRVAFATRAGVSIFDGSEWEHHTPQQGLPFDLGCERLEYDSRGRLWASGDDFSDGLAILEDGTWRALPYGAGDTATDWVRDLVLLDIEGGTTAALLSGETTAAMLSERLRVRLYDAEGWRWLRYPDGEIVDGITSLEARDDSLLAVTTRGLESFDLGRRAQGGADSATTRFSEWTSVQLPEGELLLAQFSRELSGEERLWLLAETWLGYIEEGRFHYAVEQLPGFPRKPLRRISMHGDGRGGAYFGGLTFVRHYVHSSAEVRHLSRSSGLASDGVNDFLLDQEGGLWIASLRGVTRIPRQVFESFDSKQDFLDDEVTAILEVWPGELVFGQLRGLTFFNGESAQVRLFANPETISENRVRTNDMQPDNEGGFWVATSELGVAWFHADGAIEWFEPPIHAAVNSVLEDVDSTVWVATAAGLFFLDPQSGAFESVSGVPSYPFRRLYQCPGGDLYASTGKRGLYRWRRTESGYADTPDYLLFAEDEAANNIYSVLELSDGRVMLGTRAGLMKVGEDSLEPTIERVQDGVAVYSLLEDDRGRLWAGTSRGVERWDDGEHRHYSVRHGLAGQENNRAAAFQDSAGGIWFGTDRGVSLYREEWDLPSSVLRIDVVEELVNGELLAELELSDHSDLEFDIRMVHFEDDEPEYRGRLLGYEAEWRPARPLHDHDVRYTNLPPGEYTLELQARRDGGEWGPSAYSRQVTIKTPIYQRFWFLALSFAAIGTVIAGAASLVATRRQASTLTALVEERGAALDASERRYREMFTRTSAIQLVLDPQTWGVLDANPAACRYFEASLSEIVGRTLTELTGVPVASIEAHAARLEEPDGELVLHSTEVEHGQHHVELRLCQYELRGERVVQATVHDIEGRLELEENLREAQKLRAVGELASGIAHDFNNLLAAILGFSELITYEAPTNVAVRRHVDGITEAGEQGAELVRQLLAFGRRQKLVFEELELAPIVGRFVDLLRRLFDRRIEIVCELDPHAGLIRADKTQIERVLMNLALNARDAMPDGGELKIRVRGNIACEPGEWEQDPGELVALVVEDNGVGLDEDSRSRMFEPFYTTKAPGKGTGLGLSTVHGIVGQSGGRIHVSSSPGEGASIEILFPAIAIPLAQGSRGPQVLIPAQQAGAAQRAAPSEPSELRVLLVDDEPSVRLSVGALLRSMGHDVSEAAGGLDALALLEQEGPGFDLLFTDVQMPKLTGPQLVELARAGAPELPVLYMSGFHSEGDELAEALVLQKPFNAVQLADAIRGARELSTSRA